jgi:hypothetical protein
MKAKIMKENSVMAIMAYHRGSINMAPSAASSVKWRNGNQAK